MSAFVPLLPEWCLVEEARPSLEFVSELFPHELVSIERAVDSRRAEFATGRVLARRLIRQLGVEVAEIGSAERRPLWPVGVIASITHTKDSCAVTVARDSECRGLGIDIETAKNTECEWLRLVCSDSEKEWVLAGTDEWQIKMRALAIFSAKESIYKCFNPQFGEWIGFRDVAMTIRADEGEFHAEFLLPTLRDFTGLDGVSGTISVTDRTVRTACVWLKPQLNP